MDKNMLRKALWEFLRPLLQLVTNILNPETGEEWLRELKKFLRKEECWSRRVITITRNRFNPKKFIGDDRWSIVSYETDTRSTSLIELDITKVELRTMLLDGETYIEGEEKIRRLKASDYIRLDADIFFTLWENQHLIPESWKEKMNGKDRFIYFDGTVLRSPGNDHYVLYLFWSNGVWRWLVRWLGNNYSDCSLSAVLPVSLVS